MNVLLTLAFLLAAATSRAEVSAIDIYGRKVSLPAPAQRIVALAPHIVENTYSAGAGSRLVGVASYSNYPRQAQAIPIVGNYQSWSLESIVALRPDLILMWGAGNGMEALASLEKLGVPVFISEPNKLEHIPLTIRASGQLAGTVAVSEAEAQRIEQALADLTGQYSNRRRLSVFYQVWDKPLQTVNGKHLISDVMAMCGGVNAFADAVSLAPKIGLESVLHRNPNAIVASGMDAARPEWLDEWQQYPALQAVRDNALFFIHPDHIQRPTARILLGAQRLCEQLESLRSR
jgi:iron complex transport system substrate-binding protein